MAIPKAPQVRGMLLEETLLFLLRQSGYRTVDSPDNDPTLKKHGAGIAVKGRGGAHQIDAIADYVIQQPFSNPQRLLVEAKCLKEEIGIPVARNAVGVLKDVQEYWHSGGKTKVAKSRYHYTYALFSSSGYKKTTQEYAYAQDIYLISLANSAYIQDILRVIWRLAPNNEAVEAWWPERFSLGDMRRSIRRQLVGGTGDLVARGDILPDFISACRTLNFSLLGLINGRFPIFLVPAEGVSIRSLSGRVTVRPRWDDDSWYLFRSEGNGTERKMFSFDLPEELFFMYARDGLLTAEAALNLKQAQMNEIQSVIQIGGEIRVIRFLTDNQWIEDLLARSNRGFTNREL